MLLKKRIDGQQASIAVELDLRRITFFPLAKSVGGLKSPTHIVT